MWKRTLTKADDDVNMSKEALKSVYLELLELQLKCELTQMSFDSWEQGREEMKIALMAEQCKVGDLLYMKHKIQQPIIELEFDPTNHTDDQDIKDF